MVSTRLTSNVTNHYNNQQRKEAVMSNIRKRFIATGIIIGALALAGPAAADATGAWSGAMATPNGDVTVNYNFMEDGSMLTGSTTGPDGVTIAITDGKVAGDNISFAITVDFQGMPLVMTYTGMVKGDSIYFTIDIFGMPIPLTVMRQEGA
jgi:hypothetical protein